MRPILIHLTNLYIHATSTLQTTCPILRLESFSVVDISIIIRWPGQQQRWQGVEILGMFSTWKLFIFFILNDS